MRLLRWPLVVMVLAVCAFLFLFLAAQRACRTVEQTREIAPTTVRAVGDAAAGIAARFRTGTITETFVSSIPHLLPDSGTRLELAAFEAVETFTRTDNRRMLWDALDLGTTTTEIRVPVVFRYHLRMDEPWHLVSNDHSCIVQAPQIRATLPPAIRTGGIERRAERGWARFNVDEQMEALEQTLTSKLSKRAVNEEHIALIRETCRVKVAEFVRSWLLREEHWRDDRFTSVVVIFADETQATAEAERAPTLSLEPAG